MFIGAILLVVEEPGEIERIEILEDEVLEPSQGWQELNEHSQELQASTRAYSLFSVLAGLALLAWVGLVGWRVQILLPQL